LHKTFSTTAQQSKAFGILGDNMKFWILALVIFLQSCAFLPTGPIGAKISEGYTFEGKTYKYKVTLHSNQSSHSHSFTQFLFTTPHEDIETILTNSIKGKVDANSIAVIGAYEKTKAKNLTGGNIVFSDSQVIVALHYEHTEQAYTADYMYNQRYKILVSVE
jgi:hypothetical protein